MDETTGEVKMNLREKLLRVMSDVGNVPKDGKNQGYTYQRAADIFPKVQKALLAVGVAFVAHEVECDFPPAHETKSGGTMFVATAKMRYTFHDIGSAEILTGESSGLGFDTSDKALNKAKTAALKYFLKQTLLIGEDDDDSEKDTHETSFNRTQPPRPAFRSVGSTEYVGRPQIEVLMRSAIAKMGKGNGTFQIAMWTKELGCTSETTTPDQLAELMKRVVEWRPNEQPPREPGDEPQELRNEISTNLDEAQRMVEGAMDRVGSQNHGAGNISQAQAKRLYAIAKGNKQLLKDTLAQFGFEHDRDIPKGARYDAICAALEAAQVGDAPQDSPDIEW